MTDAPVKARAIAENLPILQPSTLKDPSVISAIAALDADLGVVAAYGKLLPDALLQTPRLGMVNVHASLLPRHRGAAPVHRAVIAGDLETGVTIMRVVKALDAGPMIARERYTIGRDATSEEVERALADLGAALLVTTLDAMARGPVQEEPQDDTIATYAHRLTREDGIIDWSRPARTIHNQIRGLHPWPHAYTFLGDRRLILLASKPESGGTDAPPGTIVDASGDRLCIATGEGLLQILELQAEGRRPMQAREFLAGHPLSLGAILTTRA